MTLLVSNKQIRYRGRFDAEATRLVRAGTRVGMVWVSGEGTWHCHVCDTDNADPEFEAGHDDAMEPCVKCGTTFVIALDTHFLKQT